MERELTRIPGARLLLIPTSNDTRGHGTTGLAKFWAAQLGAWLPTVPRRP
jgi:homoserine O-acetyltransferase